MTSAAKTASLNSTINYHRDDRQNILNAEFYISRFVSRVYRLKILRSRSYCRWIQDETDSGSFSELALILDTLEFYLEQII